MAAEAVVYVRTLYPQNRRSGSHSHRRLCSCIRACQPSNDKSKFYKELGLFSLRKRIEDTVMNAEMLAPSALEAEEATRSKQEEIINGYDLWDDLNRTNDSLLKLADSSEVVDSLKDLQFKAEEARLITELAGKDVIDYRLLKQAYTASVDIKKSLDKYKISKLLKGPYDAEGACVIIEAGSEGELSEIWADRLLKMYTKWARKQGYNGRVIEKRASKIGGIKSAIIEFESKYAYGYLSGERGVHCVTRSSQSQSQCDEVSLAAVNVIPLFLNTAPDLIIDDMDLDVSYIAASKHKHRVIESVCIQHVPTGLKVQSSGERSRFANKMKALNRLKSTLLVILQDQGISDITSIDRNSIVNMWHEETRRYIFYPSKLVQDVKTGIQLPNLNSILDGNIEPLISAHINTRQAGDLG
ncbi:hypothetical protein DCAR_0417399 [Daucus carota subsp. sativus]|uniref:Peptide chain release factor domain-containing protein n=1 Tax=Daucus carota subsp. sativus TaxID=79200 RepID=A0AAF0X0M7_DAUCS|nr:hypothetical protein DCAR_0417399 [Daucus carota subsp. sativus]